MSHCTQTMGRLSAAALICACTVSARAAEAAPSEAECQARVNDTPARLEACMQKDALWKRLAHFQAIANANPGREGHGNRNTGTTGYKASADYVAGLMRHAGYAVTVQSYRWTHTEVLGEPIFHSGTATMVYGRDWSIAGISGSGDVTAQLHAISGAHGCGAGDFAGFPTGSMALMAPGPCDADMQVENAEAAGATAAIFGPDARAQGGATTARVRGQTGLTVPAHIPVVTVDAMAGAALSRLATASNGVAAHLSVQARRRSDTDYNVIADSPYGDAGNIVVVDAHLDAIYGAGMLDNASGSVSILQTALALAKTSTVNRLRYIWFGGEELGLLGSHYYTRHLSPEALSQIAFDIDVDVTATPNFDVLIADPGHASNRRRFPANVVPQSQIGNQVFSQIFQTAAIPSRYAGFGNDGTDSNSFSLVGVPNTGVLTQQDCCKKPWEVRIWGGYTGDYEGVVPGVHEACVDNPGRWCDNLSNNDPVVLGFMSTAVAEATLLLANTEFVGPAARGGQPHTP